MISVDGAVVSRWDRVLQPTLRAVSRPCSLPRAGVACPSVPWMATTTGGGTAPPAHTHRARKEHGGPST